MGQFWFGFGALEDLGFFVGVLESFVTGFGVREREERDSTRLKYVTALQAV